MFQIGFMRPISGDGRPQTPLCSGHNRCLFEPRSDFVYISAHILG